MFKISNLNKKTLEINVMLKITLGPTVSVLRQNE